MIKESLAKLVRGEHLTESEMIATTNAIMEGRASPAQIGSFLTALRLKGETVAEITGAARVMREKAVKINFKAPTVIDTCGTGGDGAQTFNISTTVAFHCGRRRYSRSQTRQPGHLQSLRERRCAGSLRG